jgi:hypothetical protein
MERHFAKLDDNDMVLAVIVVEWGKAGDAFVATLPGRWVESTADGTISKNVAGRGYKHDAAKKGFVPPRPFASWTLNEQKLEWVSPAPRLKDAQGKEDDEQKWDEAEQKWKKPVKVKDK